MIRERILEFLTKENKTSAQFAEEIGVQPSGISHILSGRNNPSLDFVLKMLERYSYISSEWLLFGKGNMYRDTISPDLFSTVALNAGSNSPETGNKTGTGTQFLTQHEDGISVHSGIDSNKMNSEVTKIVWFFSDNSFKEFYPRKD